MGAKGNPGECFRSSDVEQVPCPTKGNKGDAGEPGFPGRPGIMGRPGQKGERGFDGLKGIYKLMEFKDNLFSNFSILILTHHN